MTIPGRSSSLAAPHRCGLSPSGCRAADLTRLARLAGDATWYGPTAGAFLLDCSTVVRLTAGAAGELARAAAHLEATAAAVSAAAAASRLAVGASTAAPRPAGPILRS